MASWLKAQRKQALVDLAKVAGLQLDEGLRKDDMVGIFDAHLQQNATRLSRNQSFETYYRVRRTPYKTGSSSTAAGITSDEGNVKSVVRGRGRWTTTNIKQDVDDDDAASASPADPSRSAANISEALSPITNGSNSVLPKRTPDRPRRQTRLPPSRAYVAALADTETARFNSGLNDLFSRIAEAFNYMREKCSSLMSIQTAFIMAEGLGLASQTVPWVYMGGINLYYPDLFQLLTASFWKPTLFYTITSLVIPGLIAYLFNLTIHPVNRHRVSVRVAGYPFDPLIFNAVKALLATFMYGNGMGSHFVGFDAIEKINRGMLHGGILLDSYFMVLASIYDAALRK